MNPNDEPSPPAAIKARLSALTADEAKALSTIYHDRQRKSWLRNTGAINTFLGGLTAILGLSSFSQSWLSQVQTILGALTIAQSLWAIFAPTTGAVLRLAGVLFLLGGWNLGLLIAYRDGILTGTLGALQLWWAWGAYRAYRLQQQTPIDPLQPDSIRLYDEVWRETRRRSNLDDPESIRLWIGRRLWHGWLLEKKAVLASHSDKSLFIHERDTMHFVTAASTPPGSKRIYGRIRFGSDSARAMLNKESFEKYLRWAGQTAEGIAVSPATAYASRSIRNIMVLITVLLLLFTACVIALTLVAPTIVIR